MDIFLNGFFIGGVIGLMGWGIFTREPAHDGIGRMLTAIIVILLGIWAKM